MITLLLVEACLSRTLDRNMSATAPLNVDPNPFTTLTAGGGVELHAGAAAAAGCAPQAVPAQPGCPVAAPPAPGAGAAGLSGVYSQGFGQGQEGVEVGSRSGRLRARVDADCICATWVSCRGAISTCTGAAGLMPRIEGHSHESQHMLHSQTLTLGGDGTASTLQLHMIVSGMSQTCEAQLLQQ